MNSIELVNEATLPRAEVAPVVREFRATWAALDDQLPPAVGMP
ncbi:hypothetical protein [Chondromyces crocatus]|uniref:Uncharacterized protein n=1 Tax=Chondromyces crocatus TaxID=52 RepID=A0A0K1EBJ2_CHOCO|nr:hypothetical protein [Chondromyces crocatus]AKT38214.1 uncharacterized protein CMC5_023570 [Chondromyces crocatus]